jgi:hypothetical protein
MQRNEYKRNGNMSSSSGEEEGMDGEKVGLLAAQIEAFMLF